LTNELTAQEDKELREGVRQNLIDLARESLSLYDRLQDWKITTADDINAAMYDFSKLETVMGTISTELRKADRFLNA